jgi:hypothetical protein
MFSSDFSDNQSIFGEVFSTEESIYLAPWPSPHSAAFQQVSGLLKIMKIKQV